MAVSGDASTRLGYVRRVTDQLLDQLFPSISQSESGTTSWNADDSTAYCHRCGTQLGPGVNPEHCTACHGQPVPWDHLIRLSLYGSPVDRWVVAMKFAGDWARAEWFGRQLAPFVAQTMTESQTAVVPVPMHWLRRWHRGYNQAEIMARAVAEQNKIALANVLRRVRYTKPQTRLSESQRFANVRGSFDIGPVHLRDWHIWLIDDVKTTGATLAACARLLRKAGAASLNVAVAAVAHPSGSLPIQDDPR